MKVLFLKSIKGLAQAGDIKEISDGYARNFLLPRAIAKAATSTIAKEAENLKARRVLTDQKEEAAAKEIAERLKDAVVEIAEDANAEGHLYGSIDAKKIAHAIQTSYHIQLAEHQLYLPHNLKEVGEHTVELKLTQTIATTLTVRVLPS